MTEPSTFEHFKRLPEHEQNKAMEMFQRRLSLEGNEIGRDFRKLVALGPGALLQGLDLVRDITRRITEHQDLSDEWQRWATWIRDNSYSQIFGGPHSPHAAAAEQRKLIAEMSEMRQEANNLSGSATQLGRWLTDREASNLGQRSFNLGQRSFYFAILALVISIGGSVMLAVLPFRTIVDWYSGTAAIWGIATGLTLGAYFWRYPTR